MSNKMLTHARMLCRWMIVCFPKMSALVFTRAKSKVIIGFCWVGPILMMLPSLTGLHGKHGLSCRTRYVGWVCIKRMLFS